MKTIGLLGGMSWESTAHYYQLINEGVKHRLGGLHSAKIALVSVDFAPIASLQKQGDWATAGELLAKEAQQIEQAGAEGLLICTNTMHKVADTVQAAITIPILHIADATAEALLTAGVKNVGLLGTAFTMEQDFYKGRLADQFGLNVLVPPAEKRALIHQVIFQELCLGQINAASKQAYLRIIDQLVEQGAEAVILGCTEIGLLVKQSDTTVPLFDTTEIHARQAVEWSLVE